MTVIPERAVQLWRANKWEIIIFLVVSAVALLSFGLGYTMAKDSARTPIIIEKNSA